MNLIGKKTKLLASIWLISLLLALGCVSGSSGGYPTFNYPLVPLAVSSPHDVWVKCSSLGAPEAAVISKMYCVDEGEYLDLRRFVIELDSLIVKYENTIKEINKLE
jgi:hypothetical protein